MFIVISSSSSIIMIPKRVKDKIAKIKMSDGYRSGRSTGSVVQKH